MLVEVVVAILWWAGILGVTGRITVCCGNWFIGIKVGIAELGYWGETSESWS